MATPGRAPASDLQPAPSSEENAASDVYKIPYTEKTVPKWAAHLLAGITVISVAYQSLSGPINQVVTVYRLGRAASDDANEAYKHYSETPAKVAQYEDAAGRLEARLYASDGCVAVLWHSALDPNDSHPHFVRNLTNPDHAPAPGRIAFNQSATPPSSARAAVPVSLLELRSFDPAAAEKPATPDLAKTTEARLAAAAPIGRCLNPHPGAFKTRYGETKECWIQVWRDFADGCKHYQWFNKCGTYWDANPDGTPRVYWTECHH